MRSNSLTFYLVIDITKSVKLDQTLIGNVYFWAFEYLG